MPRPLQNLWRALELLPDLAAVPAEWRSLLGEEEHRLLQRLLLPTQRLARSVKSTVAGRLCVHEIRRFKGEFLSVCPDGCETATLSRDEIVVHNLDVSALCCEIAEALGLDAAEPAALPHVNKAMHIGDYVPYSGHRFVACFAAIGEPDDMLRAVGVLAADGKPFILLAPTREAFTRACADRVNRSKSCFIALAETLGLDDDGRFALLNGQKATDLFAEFRDTHVPQRKDDDGMVVFPTPPDAQWEDVIILFKKDAHTVSVSVWDVQRVLNYTKMGMADKRTGNPNVQWDLLHGFALASGKVGWKDRRGGQDPAQLRLNRELGVKYRKQKQLLAGSLRRFFGIKGDPFILASDGGWKSRFTVTEQADAL